MGKTTLLLASMVLAVLLACGVALAATITRPTGASGLCLGTAKRQPEGHRKPRQDGRAGRSRYPLRRAVAGLFGGGAATTPFGHGGEDFLFGDMANSEMATGNDRILGGPRNDHILGGPGADVMKGGPGRDEIGGSPAAKTRCTAKTAWTRWAAGAPCTEVHTTTSCIPTAPRSSTGD